MVTATFSDHGCMELQVVQAGSRTAVSKAATASRWRACQLAARIQRMEKRATAAITAACQVALSRYATIQFETLVRFEALEGFERLSIAGLLG